MAICTGENLLWNKNILIQAQYLHDFSRTRKRAFSVCIVDNDFLLSAADQIRNHPTPRLNFKQFHLIRMVNLLVSKFTTFNSYSRGYRSKPNISIIFAREILSKLSNEFQQ